MFDNDCYCKPNRACSKPIIALTDNDIHNTGKVYVFAQDTMQQSRDNFAKTINELGDKILALTE